MSDLDPRRLLRDSERETLTPDERAMFDEAVLQIPSERNAEFTAQMIGSRGMVRHHGKDLVNAAQGWKQIADEVEERYRDLLDASDARSAKFVTIAREFRAGQQAADARTAQLIEKVEGLTKKVDDALGTLRSELSEHITESRSDRKKLNERQDATEERLSAVETHLTGVEWRINWLVIGAVVLGCAMLIIIGMLAVIASVELQPAGLLSPVVEPWL